MGEKKPVEDGGHEDRVEVEEDKCKAEEKEANHPWDPKIIIAFNHCSNVAGGGYIG